VITTSMAIFMPALMKYQSTMFQQYPFGTVLSQLYLSGRQPSKRTSTLAMPSKNNGSDRDIHSPPKQVMMAHNPSVENEDGELSKHCLKAVSETAAPI